MKTDYSLATLDYLTMQLANTDKKAFLNAAKLNIDSAIRSITLSMASALFRSGTGSIGLIAAGGITSGVITLSDPQSVVQFENGMTLQANATDGGTPRAALGYVVAVNRTAGTVTVSTAQGGGAASPSGWAPADFLLVQGDNNAKPSGLAAWIPVTAPTGGDSFYGVNRSTDPTRLAGIRYDGSAQSIEEALIDASALTVREGGKPDLCIMGFASYSNLIKSLGSKVQYIDLKGPADVGFTGVQIISPNGKFNVVADRNCPGQTAYLLTMKSWAVESAGTAPRINDFDGNQMLRVYNQDAGELRVSAYYNLRCDAPGQNSVVILSA